MVAAIHKSLDWMLESDCCLRETEPSGGMSRIALECWQAACRSVGIEDAEHEYRRVLRAWSSMGRRYHTLEHLNACLLELDAAQGLAQHVGEVELALWFHDAVYRTWARDNETKSAAWAERFLNGAGVPATQVTRVRKHVLATAHHELPLGGDTALVVDIDLSILGQPDAVYDAFEANVRREYWWVPRSRYVAARRRVLESFIARPTIYHWPLFRDRYDAAARRNIGRALERLATR